MRSTLILLTGIFFGLVLTKAEIVSWYRIQEMFHFHSFHMFGVIGSAVVLGVLARLLMKRLSLKTVDGEAITYEQKAPFYRSALIGGTIFGLGWAMTGACPGPIYILIGQGYGIVLLVLAGAVAGAWLQGWLRDYLPR